MIAHARPWLTDLPRHPNILSAESGEPPPGSTSAVLGSRRSAVTPPPLLRSAGVPARVGHGGLGCRFEPSNGREHGMWKPVTAQDTAGMWRPAAIGRRSTACACRRPGKGASGVRAAGLWAVPSPDAAVEPDLVFRGQSCSAPSARVCSTDDRALLRKLARYTVGCALRCRPGGVRSCMPPTVL